MSRKRYIIIIIALVHIRSVEMSNEIFLCNDYKHLTMEVFFN